MDLQQALIAVFSVASGYASIQACPYTATRWDAHSWEQNFFESGALGAGLFIGARLLKGVPLVASTFQPVRDVLWGLVPVPFATTFVGAIVIGVAGSWLISLIFTPSVLVRAAIQKYGDDLEKLLLRALEGSIPIMITIEHRKVYVGFVLSMPTLSERDRHAKLLPLKSGYRDSGDLRVHWTTDYAAVLEQLSREIEAEAAGGDRVKNEVRDSVQDWQLFGTVLPLERMTSATLFDDGVYRRFADGDHVVVAAK